MNPTFDMSSALACPIPRPGTDRVLMAHGGGGRMMRDLIERVFMAAFHNPILSAGGDSAILPLDPGPLFRRLAFTTDTYVVHPLFFPGGDIGRLSVFGTVNDLAVCGAKPLGLSIGFILEEGLATETLERVVRSVQRAADEAGVRIVTGDTKVVDRGRGDGIFINTAGVGLVDCEAVLAPGSVRPGDALMVNGDIGRHGMAIMAVREGLAFESEIESDAAPLGGLVQDLLSAGVEIHCMRDLTRGGLASALNEIAASAGLPVEIDESLVPVREDVRAACEVLGLDPLSSACEGRLVAFVPRADADRCLALMRSHPHGEGARMIGEVGAESSLIPGASVTIRSRIGVTRILDTLSGEQLPRIC